MSVLSKWKGQLIYLGVTDTAVFRLQFAEDIVGPPPTEYTAKHATCRNKYVSLLMMNIMCTEQSILT